jgi:hypothetical protein
MWCIALAARGQRTIAIGHPFVGRFSLGMTQKQ